MFCAPVFPLISVDFIFDVNIFLFLESVADLICKSLPRYVRVE